MKATFQELQRLKQGIIDLGMYLVEKPSRDWKNNVEMLNFWWNTRVKAFSSPQISNTDSAAENTDNGKVKHIYRVLQDLYNDWENIRNQLAVQYMPIVNQIARHYGNENVDPGDIMQEGYRGLLRAIDSYDLDFGVPFEAYARHWLHKYLSSVVTYHANVVRIPDSAIKQNRQAKKNGDNFVKESAVLPHFEWEISNLEDSSEITAEERYKQERTRTFLNECVASLNEKEQKVIKLRYYNELTPTIALENVSKQMGCSRESARLWENSALDTLRKKIESGRSTPSSGLRKRKNISKK